MMDIITPPHFFYFDEDGTLNMEWCFGEQGAQDSWRVMFVVCPDQGTYLIETRHTGQNFFRGEEAIKALPALLDEAGYLDKE